MSIEKALEDINMSKRLRMARVYAEIDQAKAADILSISTVTLSRYENGKRDASAMLVKEMSKAYGVSLHWLLTGEGSMLESKPTRKETTRIDNSHSSLGFKDNTEPSNVSAHYNPRPVMRVPLISWVQAGNWADSNCQTTPGYAEEYIDSSATNSENAFALTIKGDSMEPEFREGDIITVDPDRQVENGSYVIVKNGVEATFKQYVVDGISVYLKPLNDRYPIRDMTGVEFLIVGVVVEKRKRY